MPTFFFNFNDGRQILENDLGLEFPDLEQAYLAVCASIPDEARDLIIQRLDPLKASYTITDTAGRTLMNVPFSDVLTGAEWRRTRASRRSVGGPRSAGTRDRLALKSFRQMFGAARAGCVLLTPDMHIVEMNEFGAKHSHVDLEEIRGQSIFNVFDLHGQPKADFNKFMSLAEVGVASEVIDLPYLVLNSQGETANGWWNARTWPIFDDQEHLLGFVEWAEPHTERTQDGLTQVKVSKIRSF